MIWIFLLYLVGFFITMYFILKTATEESLRFPAVGIVIACGIWPVWWIWVAVDMVKRKSRLW